MSETARYFNTACLDGAGAKIYSEPFPFFITSGALFEERRAALKTDFPKFKEAGFVPYEDADCGAAIHGLVAEAISPAVADALGRKIGIEGLSKFPTLVTISGFLHHRHGNIHTDGKSKVATALVYLNEDWPQTSGGCLRFLRSADNIEDMVAPEIRPLYGSFAIFKRTDNSFHGHLPHEGERRVIQIAWLTSEEEKRRKTKRGRVSQFLKRLLGGFDKNVGAGRDRTAKM